MGRIALIDGDVLCYLSFEPRWNFVTDKSGQIVKTWNNETQSFEKKVKEYTKEEDQQYKKETWERFKKKVQETIEEVYADEYLMVVQGVDNFRLKLYDLYKFRDGKPSEMSQWVPMLRQLAVLEDLAIASDGREADDYLRIWAEESRLAGKDFVVCSNDKDLLCIPGLHYNIKKKEFITVNEEQALRLYHEQLIMGDPIDKIPGIPGIGPKRAEKILKDCKTVDDFQETVVETYISMFGDSWKQHLLANGKLIHLQRHLNDWFDLSDWPVIEGIENAKTV